MELALIVKHFGGYRALLKAFYLLTLISILYKISTGALSKTFNSPDVIQGFWINGCICAQTPSFTLTRMYTCVYVSKKREMDMGKAAFQCT